MPVNKHQFTSDPPQSPVLVKVVGRDLPDFQGNNLFTPSHDMVAVPEGASSNIQECLLKEPKAWDLRAKGGFGILHQEEGGRREP